MRHAGDRLFEILPFELGHSKYLPSSSYVYHPGPLAVKGRDDFARQQNELKVFMSSRDFVSGECHEPLGRHAWIHRVGEGQVLYAGGQIQL
jgi:hypothetical protein